MHIAHLELARDYISAGLLDRAEKLLLDLERESEEQRDVSRQHLIEIYRSESEWGRAIEVARTLLPRKSLLRGVASTAPLPGQPVREQLAHFYCELALTLSEKGNVTEARKRLREALEADPGCVRASLELGRLEAAEGHHERAIKALKQVVAQNPDFLPEAIPALRESHAAIGEEQALSRYLSECFDEHPATPVMIAVAEDLVRDRGVDAARRFLEERLAEVPSLRGLRRLVRLQQESDNSVPGESLSILGVLLDRLIRERPVYRCEHCGFSAKHLLWFCPGCKYWGMFRTIRATETE
jgi:lipopolysaccharide biosynthesis regulator YciM